MMLWRISNYCDLSGVGAETFSGRWHTAGEGKRTIYLAEHPALALIEILVHLRGNPRRVPSVFQLLKVAVSDEVSVQTVDRASLSDGWEFKQTITQNIGDNWLASTPTALLAIPSAPSPESTNYLLNGLHPDAHKIKIEWCRWITYDDRLLGIREKS